MTTTPSLQVNSGITTSWIALTSPPPTPTSCASFYYAPNPLSSAPLLVVYDPNNANALFPTPCWPAGVTSWWNQRATSNSIITSLGPFVCPSGYTAAWSKTQSSSALTGCCPSNFDYGPTTNSPLSEGFAYQCSSWISSGTLQYVARDTSTTTQFDTSITSLSEGQLFSVIGVQVNGWNFNEVEIKSTSAQSLSFASITSMSNGFSTTPVASRTSPTTSTNSLAVTGGPGSGSDPGITNKKLISSGVIVGIAVAGIISLLFAALIACFLVRRRKVAAEAADEQQFSDKMDVRSLQEGRYEMDCQQERKPAVIQGSLKCNELSGEREMHELAGDGIRFGRRWRSSS